MGLLARVTSARASDRVTEYEKWISKGMHGEMKSMAREDRIARRRDPQLVLPGARSVVMVAMHYWPGASGFPAEHQIGKEPQAKSQATDRGIVSCYAWGDDYHTVLQGRLRNLGKWLCERTGGVARYYVDTGAVLERDFAERAGLGFVGKNSMLISPRGGSGSFLGALFTTAVLDLDGDSVPKQGPGKPGCGRCTKCRVACPTDAIVEDRIVDARRCISYLTIELKGSIPIELRKLMGARIYGCDICQVVCPWNRVDWATPGVSPLWGSVERFITTPLLTELLNMGMDDAEFKKRFAGTAIYRIGAERMARNAAVALGNIGSEVELDAVTRASVSHPSALVREHAQWAAGEITQRMASTRNT